VVHGLSDMSLILPVGDIFMQNLEPFMLGTGHVAMDQAL